MKSFLIGFGLLFSWTLNAQTLVSADPKTPFVQAACATIGQDLMGRFGLRLESFVVDQNEKEITLKVASSLVVCRLNADAQGQKSLSWLSVNPYRGFFVQYFNDQTQSILERPVFIDTQKPANRIELSVAVSPKNVSQARMEESLENTFTAQIKIKKSDLLTRRDLRKIRRGETVQKTVELYHVGNFTTIVDGVDQSFGDQGLSAQNVILIFK